MDLYETITLESLRRTAPSLASAIEGKQEITILSKGKPLAKIVSLPLEPATARPFGLCKGKFTVPKDFNEPLTDLEDEIYGS